MPYAYLCNGSNGSLGSSKARFLVLNTRWMRTFANDCGIESLLEEAGCSQDSHVQRLPHPYRVRITLVIGYPGRCPGLSCHAPSGRTMGVVPCGRTPVRRCPFGAKAGCGGAKCRARPFVLPHPYRVRITLAIP